MKKLESAKDGLGVQVQVIERPSLSQGVGLIRLGQSEFYRLELINKVFEGVLFLE